MTRRGFWLRHALWPTALLTLALLAVSRAGLDLWLADRFFDAAAGGFAGRHAAALQALHGAERWLPVSAGGGALLLWLAGFALPAARRFRRGALYVALCFAVGPGLVVLGKHVSNVDCPRDLQRYGGDRPYVGLLEDRPDALPRAECFPSGHASGAYAFFAFYFLLRRYRSRAAPAALAGAIALGLAFGLTQWARGAHFLSHDLWAAGLCWHVSLALAAACLRRAAPRPQPAPPLLRASPVH